MLRPSRPMIRPFISSFGRWTTDDRVLGGVVRGDPLHRGDDDVAGLVLGLLAGASLDGAGELHGVVLGLLADGLEQHGLRVLGADMPLTRARAPRPAPGGRCARSSRVLSSSRSRSRSLRSRCSSMSVRWSSCSSRWSRRRSSVARVRCAWRAPRPRPRACSRSFSSFASRISSFWRARASASIRRASACAAFIVWDAHMLRDEYAKHGAADGGHEGHRDDERCVHLYPPVRRRCGRRIESVVRRRPRRERRHRPMGRSMRGDRSPVAWAAPLRSGAVQVCRVAYGASARTATGPYRGRTGRYWRSQAEPRDAEHTAGAIGRYRRRRRGPGGPDR